MDLFIKVPIIYHCIFLSKKTINNIRKAVYNKYNDYIQYIKAINTPTLSSSFAFDKFEKTLHIYPVLVSQIFIHNLLSITTCIPKKKKKTIFLYLENL